MIAATCIYDGPFYLKSLQIVGTDSDQTDWLEDVDDEEAVCIIWTNCAMTMKAKTARAWLGGAVLDESG